MAMMNALRSVIFNFAFVGGVLVLGIFLLWTFLLPPEKALRVIARVYGGYVTWIEKNIMGLHLDLRGLEHVPKDGVFILASKHQSAYETLKLPYMKELGYPATILKKSLTRLPIWGQYAVHTQQIAIDRSKGPEAMRIMADKCRASFDKGRPVMIFPQGTRTPPGSVRPYKQGVARLYTLLNVPVVPVALNTGSFWGRNAFFKKPGRIVIEILPPIVPGLSQDKMMAQLQDTIESATLRLEEEARMS